MRYVAFIDTLGFKQRITKISHEEAVEVIRQFNQSIYNIWRDMGLDRDETIRGRTFSDSVIVHSQDDSKEELEKIIKFLINIYKESIINCDLPLRGGLANGSFDDIQAIEFDNLQKGLLVGTAFIDAYLLESDNGIKGSKLLFGQEINLKIERQLSGFETKKVKVDPNGRTIYELKWGDLIYLTESNYEALNKFIELGSKSKWLDHYFGTLETFLIKESEENKQEIYVRIIEKLKADYKYNDLDNFLENYLKSESATYTKRSFLKFLREKI
ncbi:hypothetical protein [Xanthomarina gelatinilytica]|uniref:hypothetical protein n=2 Tax=Xanthomarina gelatinilytica TaxID=1137281 RepID=UPI003AA92836